MRGQGYAVFTRHSDGAILLLWPPNEHTNQKNYAENVNMGFAPDKKPTPADLF